MSAREDQSPARLAAIQAVEAHPSTTFMAPCESLADAVLAAAVPLIRAEVIAEVQTEFVAWLVKKAHERRALGRQYAKQAEFIGVLADKAHRGAVRVFLEAGPEPLIVDRFDTATEPAPEEEQLLTIGCIAEDGRPVALLLDPENRAKVGRWLNPSTANGEDLPAYRAEHDSIVMGLYQTPEEARRHCETKVQQEEPSGSIQHMSWWADDTGDEATYELHITPAETDGLIRGTGYVVTPLTVAAAYDAEADE